MAEQYSQKWCVVAFFDALELNFQFHRTEIPLHATIAGVFAIDKSREEINVLLKNYLDQFGTFEITGGEIVNWGDIQVTLLVHSDDFDVLFKGVQQMLIDNGALFNEPEYLGDGFMPHVTAQRHAKLDTGKKMFIKSITLVDMFPDGDFEQRLISGNHELKNV